MNDTLEINRFCDCGSLTAQLVGHDHIWHVVVIHQALFRASDCLSVALGLKHDLEYLAELIDSSPRLMNRLVDHDAHLVSVPGTSTTGYPRSELLGDIWAEADAAGTNSFVSDADAALKRQFLHVAAGQGETAGAVDGFDGCR